MTKASKKTGFVLFISLIITLLAVSHFYLGSSITQLNLINTTVNRGKVPLLSGFPGGPKSEMGTTSDLWELLLAGIVA